MSKIEQDKRTILSMIEIYCQRHLHTDEIPEEYRQLGEYACRRLDLCRYGEAKPACKDCSVHCYRKDMRDKMKRVMRWVGPRMLIYSPKRAFRHLLQVLRYRFSTNVRPFHYDDK